MRLLTVSAERKFQKQMKHTEQKSVVAYSLVIKHEESILTCGNSVWGENFEDEKSKVSLSHHMYIVVSL